MPSKIWLTVWISTADKAMENCFPYDHFSNYLGFGSKQIDLQNALMELNSKGIDLDLSQSKGRGWNANPATWTPNEITK